MNVFLLATCRNPDLLPATLLVFETLRVGFPDANIVVSVNTNRMTWPGGNVPTEEGLAINQAAISAGVNKVFLEMTCHWEWIRRLVESETDPFFLCDTDVVFWKSIEDHPMFNGETKPYLAGRYMPEFFEELTKAYAQPRLHTSLMFIDPVRLREKIAAYQKTIPETWFTKAPDLFKPLIVPNHPSVHTQNSFYDTASLLYHAVSGFRFPDDLLDRYDHLHGACSADLMEKYGYINKVAHDRAVFANPELIRGSWREHDKYFASRAR